MVSMSRLRAATQDTRANTICNKKLRRLSEILQKYWNFKILKVSGSRKFWDLQKPSFSRGEKDLMRPKCFQRGSKQDSYFSWVSGFFLYPF